MSSDVTKDQPDVLYVAPSTSIYGVGEMFPTDSWWPSLPVAPVTPSTDNRVLHEVHVDKRIERIRFENETEDHVTIVIERKGDAK